MLKKKWIVSAVVVGMSSTAVLSGCSTNADKTEVSTAASTDAAKAASDPNSMDKTVNLKVVSQTKYAPNSVPNEYTKQTEQKFNMKWDYQAIPLSAGMDKYNVMFASGDYPDFIPNMNNWNAVKKWASAGYLLPIGDYFDKLPNYRKLYTDEQWKMLQDFTSVNGKIYMLPSITTTYDPMAWIYRKDVFDKAGITSFPKTTDEFMAALQKIKETNPNFIGVGVRGGSGNTGVKALLNSFANTFRVPADFAGSTGWTSFWKDPDMNNQVVFSPATTKQRDMLKYLAKLYKAGLIQKDFATGTEDQFNQNRLNGKDVIDFQWVSQIVSLEKQNKNADWEYARTYLEDTAGGKGPLMFKGPDFALFGSILSNKLAEEPDKLNRLLKYLDWSSTPEGQLFNQLGVENLTYVMKDGVPIYKDDLDRKKVLEQYGFDYFITKSDAAQKADPTYAITAEAAPVFKQMTTVLAPYATLTEDETNTVNSVMTGVWNEVYQFATKAVMGLVNIEDDKVWNDHLSNLNKVGLDKALAIYQKAIK
ncbi:extracellular solute-binding protein [Bacillus sp. 3255]|uniref:extracellular solute-binding protein n=1 Tax=Bacillus sp. 3255 TaxID=2817904 RepID=UPI00285F897F|nr:extracellular solute-binding protein [Bacillus sp. 3255]MDR6879926.1 ABC-type glycerol-3-phosphate transport system substrate-binding protein [Bacillus sp. 3255]